MPHHVDRFGTALAVLAGHGHIKHRLIRAFEENLTDIDDAALPRPVCRSFRDLRRRLTAVAPLNGEGPICASVRKMSITEADECARLIVGMYGEILQSGSGTSPVSAAAETTSLDVPAMLLKSV
jgi:hypothetical protein